MAKTQVKPGKAATKAGVKKVTISRASKPAKKKSGYPRTGKGKKTTKGGKGGGRKA